ncbi:PREDICTED: GTPase RhebL1 isoform X1 [Gavialis gangeticus]|uniref:GTPase RhebL1 isoform X1 n=1 Tax=Gavialis gangeticus TaxID=94835 RepID=UPI00092FD633|nr:PREDICTED: GTPase RhebL1 isoform X1 [Gavialis gangeticus]
MLWLLRRPRPGGLFIARVAGPACAALTPHPHRPARRAMPLVRYRKVVILGYRSVGKTSLAHQFVEGEFLECYDPTVESTYNKMLVVGKDEFHLQLVDTAGQDEYTILPHSFVIGIHGYVLVYSVTSLRSFQVVKTLHNKLYESRGKTRMPVVLVGNKADLSLESREVKTDEGKKLADSWGAIFLESSAKENQVWHTAAVAGAEGAWSTSFDWASKPACGAATDPEMLWGEGRSVEKLVCCEDSAE